MACEQFAVAMPITVEMKLPESTSRHAYGLTVLGFIGKVGNHYNIIRWSALVPPMENKNLSLFVKMVDLCELSAEPSR
jgi:hypothetical protein